MKIVRYETIMYTFKDNMDHNVAESVVVDSQMFHDKERFNIAGIETEELSQVKITVIVEQIGNR